MKMEIRNNNLYIEGYVNAVERESRQLPSPRGVFNEVVKAGAWEKALNSAENVDLLFNHNENRNLGSIKKGNLKLYEDNIGLKAEAIISDLEIIEKAKNNELRGWSFKFSVNKGGDEWKDIDGKQIRYLHDFALYEVSILSVMPAYYGTSIEARGEESHIIEVRSHEETFKVENYVEVDKKPLESEERQNKPCYDLDYMEKEIEILKLG